jgi:hypothetical protein
MHIFSVFFTFFKDNLFRDTYIIRLNQKFLRIILIHILDNENEKESEKMHNENQRNIK